MDYFSADKRLIDGLEISQERKIADFPIIPNMLLTG